MNENDGDRDEPGSAAPRKTWMPPTLEVVPMDDTEATLRGNGADSLADYS
jgi:hypothetical protein